MKLSNLLRKAQSVKQKLEHPYTAAVIVAAGSATRMGGVDKIFAPIAKLPVICRTLAAEFDVVAELAAGKLYVWKGELPDGELA